MKTGGKVGGVSSREVGHLGERRCGRRLRGHAEESQRRRAGADDDDVSLERGAVGDRDADGAGRLAQRRDRSARGAARNRRRAGVRGDRRRRPGRPSPVRRAPFPPRRCRENAVPLRRPRASSTGAPAAVNASATALHRRVIAQRHLAGDVEQSATCRDLEVVPTGAGEDGHLDVTAIGVAEAEDARVAL